ncbi:hypothetical protein K440DRAFT_320567 [Wilcoxina mikolae CBS 423.85]|nr:hypothetical protein K440DRAFT_320567 [Wilcoxina mikolae CBS 423.85]
MGINSRPGSDTVKLEEFLYTRGFREGACSDITVIAFGTRYRLHRLILDRSPYFSSFFNGGPWAESGSSEITLSPETADSNITQHAFQLALARLYGHVDAAEEDQHALPLLAAASFLELQDLAESCVASLLRNLGTSGITDIVTFVTNSYYGPLTDQLLESAKALLYRDGWEMDFAEGWDGISGEFAAEIIGFDGFYCPNEYARYCFVRDLINWRMRQSYSAQGSPIDDTYMKVPEVPTSESPLSFDNVSDIISTVGDDDADIRPLRDLLETGIYYCHIDFAQLQSIAEDTDILGRPMVSDKTIKDALWQQMILRQKVINAPIDSPELGISKREYRRAKSTRRGKSTSNSRLSTGSRKTVATVTPRTSRLDLLDMGRTPGRKYLIPSEDSSTTVIGDCPEQSPRVGTSGNPRGTSSGNRDSIVNLDLDISETEAEEELRYSEFPPFRFSAEFKNIRTLKERKRVYSNTVFYAGSYWNIYIQKVVKGTKNIQLGVYLHRAKDSDGGSGNSSRDTEQLVGILNTNQKSDAEGGDTTVVNGETTSTTVSLRPGANTSASRTLPGGGIASSSLPESSDPALGYYVDTRPMIQTYFKIFSPSRKGKMLSMFSSRPDSFNFSQSWGWKSSSLILDEVGSGEDSSLRFMVVLGNV